MFLLLSWRRHRRAAHDGFTVKAIEEYEPIQARAAIEAALSCLAHSEDWKSHVEWSVFPEPPPKTTLCNVTDFPWLPDQVLRFHHFEIGLRLAG